MSVEQEGRNLNISNTRNTTLVAVGVIFGMSVAVVAIAIYMWTIGKSETNIVVPFGESAVNVDRTALTESTEGISSRDTFPTMDEIVRTLQSPSKFERPVVLYEVIAQADRGTLEGMISQLGQVEDASLSNEILVGVFHRLAAIDPVNAMDVLASLSEYHATLAAQVVFEKWAVMDLDRALKHAKELDTEPKGAAIRGILRSRVDLSALELLEIARQFGNEEKVLDEFAARTARSLVGNANEVWTEVLAVYGNDVTQHSDVLKRFVVNVATRYVVQSGADALQQVLVALPNRESRIYVGSGLLEQISHDDPSGALDLATSVIALDRDILESVVRNWAKSDGFIAFKAAQNVDAGGNRMQRAALDAWAVTEPDSFLDKLDQVPENLRTHGMQRALQSIARATPMVAVELLDGIEDSSVKGSVIRTIVDSWSDEDPKGAFEWSKSNSTSQSHMKYLHSMILRKLVQTDPEQAMEIALAETANEFDVGLEAEVVEEMSGINVDQALSMLNQTRNAATRAAAQTAVGVALIRQGKADAAISLVQEEPLRIQQSYFLYLAQAWAKTDHKDLLSRMDDLPQDEILLMNVAGELASEHWRKAISLTLKEKDLVRKHLPEMMGDVYLK